MLIIIIYKIINKMKFFKYKLKLQQRKILKTTKINNSLEIYKKYNIIFISLESIFLTPLQLKTIYSIINKFLKKQYNIVFKCFPHINWSKKPIEIRMGRGKGSIKNEICKIQKGFPILLLNINDSIISKIILQKCQYKLKLKTKIVVNNFLYSL